MEALAAALRAGAWHGAGMLELISLHVPKCAGSSLRAALAAAYAGAGEGAFWADYADRPGNPASAFQLDPAGYHAAMAGWAPPVGARAVHGHFHPGKYRRHGAGALKAVFLRHPVSRLISHYRFWQALPRHGHLLHDYMLDTGLDMEGFARLPLQRHFYTGLYLRDVDMGWFDFIGLQEHYAGDVARLAALLGRPLALRHDNAGALPPQEDPALIARLEDILH
ncbi:MAG TPA: hypothetical protein VFF94_03700, partial [Novosphingobium sp.]|nr:hypothetical protein [Novosphingobium sp.]